MKKVYEEIEKLEKDNNIVHLELSSPYEKIALIRTTGNDFLGFSKELSEKVQTAIYEHFSLDDPEDVNIRCSEFNAQDGISKLICNLPESESNMNMTLSFLHIY